MNKEESSRLLDEIRHNDSIRNKVIRLAKICSILDNVDLTKTRIFGVLSNDFPQIFNKDFPKNGRISEKMAFFEFLTNNLTLKDFRKKIEHLEYKVKGILNNHVGALLELILVDVLSRKGPGLNHIKHRKGPTEIDGEYKVDMISSYRHLDNKFRFGVQLTISDGLKARKKNKKIEGVIHRIDSGKNGSIFGNKMTLDSMIYIKLNGVIADILGSSPDIIANALANWKKRKFEGNILEYIENGKLIHEINRFCEIYLYVLNLFFTTLETILNEKRFGHKIIELPGGELIDINYSDRENNIKFSISENGRQLFSMKFFLNKQLSKKLNREPEIEKKGILEGISSSDILFSEYRDNDSKRSKVNKLIEYKAVLKEIDKTRTKVWGLLSEGFLIKRNIGEIRAFHEYLSSRFRLSDFEKSIEGIISKDEAIYSQGDGIILEYILVEKLTRLNINGDLFSFQKGSSELDANKKTDFIANYKPNGEQYKIGVQVTAIQEREIKYHKMGQVKSAIKSIDNGKDVGKFSKKLMLDSILFVEFLGIFAEKKGKSSNQLQQALSQWRSSGYIGDVVDHIVDIRFKKEINTFCITFTKILQIIFHIIKDNFQKINQNIILENGIIIKIIHKKNNNFLMLSAYDNKNNLLFKIHFLINQKLLSKINGNKTEDYPKVVNM